MPLTVSPLGVRCNLQCGYCYEDPQRDAGNLGVRYDVEAMKQSIAVHSREEEPFLLFGGEPLLLPKRVLEDLWAWGFARAGQNSVQTNGALIDDDHVALFKRFRVGVGISIDGPGELNDARWDHTLERTRRSTARTEAAIQTLLVNGLVPSLIVTLHRLNANTEAIETLIAWFHKLESLGIRRIGLHLLEVENETMRAKFELTADETVAVIGRLRAARSSFTTVTLTLLDDLELLLQGRDARSKCIWQACDPYTTRAVKGIDGRGERNKCSRVNKDGVDFLPADSPGYERYIALYRTPQSVGGCSGCRFFLMCRGQCPGTAISGDWRNRSEQCGTWKRVFAQIEGELVAEGVVPLSLRPERAAIEAELVRRWEAGENWPVEHVMRSVRAKASVYAEQSSSVASG